MPYPVKCFFEVYEDMVGILLMLQVLLAEDPEIEYLFCGAPSGSETCLLFCNDLFRLWLESILGDLQHDLTRMADNFITVQRGPNRLQHTQLNTHVRYTCMINNLFKCMLLAA